MFVQANAYAGAGDHGSVVPVWKVVGSRGSVSLYFRKQKTPRPYYLTDAAMTRFWLTLEQGVRFVVRVSSRCTVEKSFFPKILV